MHQERLSKSSGVDLFFQRQVAWIEATHEAELEQAGAVLGLSVDDFLCFRGGRGEGFLAEDGFAYGYGSEDLVFVDFADGADEDCVDVGGVDEIGGVGVGFGVGVLGDGVGNCGVDVADRCEVEVLAGSGFRGALFYDTYQSLWH